MISRGHKHQHDDQTGHDQHHGNQPRQGDAAPARRKLAPDDPVLAFKISMEADEQDDDADAQKGGSEGFAQVSKSRACVVEVRFPGLQQQLVQKR